MPSFWASFWPAFAATAAGVVLGIPTGLYVARLATSLAKRARRKETCEALDGLLVALRAALVDLRHIPDDVDRTAPGIIPLIIWRPQQAVWDLLSPVVLEGVADLKLKVRLARCFEVMHGVPLLLDRLYELESAALGPTPYAARARATADGLKDILKNRANEVATFTEAVCSETDAYLTAHRPAAGG
jgi:hypothetical protein